MRAKYLKLRSFLEAYPKVFALTNDTSADNSSLLGEDKAEQYAISLVSSSPAISAVDILSMMMPQIQTELPKRVETVCIYVEVLLIPFDFVLCESISHAPLRVSDLH